MIIDLYDKILMTGLIMFFIMNICLVLYIRLLWKYIKILKKQIKRIKRNEKQK